MEREEEEVEGNREGRRRGGKWLSLFTSFLFHSIVRLVDLHNLEFRHNQDIYSSEYFKWVVERKRRAEVVEGGEGNSNVMHLLAFPSPLFLLPQLHSHALQGRQPRGVLWW